jgi:hypothetical protein
VNGVTGDCLEGSYGWSEVGVTIAWIDDGQPSPHEFDVRIDRAVEDLRKWDARLVVAAAGDWISYASLEATVRTGIAVVIVLIALLGLLLLRARLNRKHLRELPRAPASNVSPRPSA